MLSSHVLSTFDPWFASLAAAAPPAAGGDIKNTIIMFGMVFGIIYFLVLRPQKQKENEHQEMLKVLKKNDRVLTQGGLYGVIARIDGGDVVLKIDLDKSVKVKVRLSAITNLVTENTEKSKKSKKSE